MGCIYFVDSFTCFCLQINGDAKYYFLSCPSHYDRGLIVIRVYYFQIWNKENNIIIIRRIIICHMVTMYIETHYTKSYFQVLKAT